MCVVSAVHDYGRRVQDHTWSLPGAVDAWEELIRRGQRFDEIADQPHCEDPSKVADLARILELGKNAKLKEEQRVVEPAPEWATNRIVELEKQVKELQARTSQALKARDDAMLEAHDALIEIDRLQAIIGDAKEADVEVLTVVADTGWAQETIASVREKMDDLFHDRTQILAAFARYVRYVGGLDVWIALTEQFGVMQVFMELPTGQVSFQFNGVDSALFSGLPFGTSDRYDGHDTDTRWERVNAVYA